MNLIMNSTLYKVLVQYSDGLKLFKNQCDFILAKAG